MNILFFADPNSIHDEKWISYFSKDVSNKVFILPRAGQMINMPRVSHKAESILLDPITDFSIVRFYKTIATAIKIRQLIRVNEIQLIHILYAEPNILWCLFRKFFGVPMIVSCRGTDVLKTIPEVFAKRRFINFAVAPAYRWAFRMADWITGTSQKQLAFISLFLEGKGNTSIIRTGVDFEVLKKQSLLPAPLLKDVKFILFPRYIRPIYNHEFCLSAIEVLPEKIKEEYKMVFLGRNNGDPLYQEKIEKRMKELGSVSFVFLEKQSQEQLIELYRRASLVVMTPLSDGSPVSAMEAVLCGTQVILGPLDYDKEIFEESCHILKNWDPQVLSELMNGILQKKVTPKLLSEEVREMMNRDTNMRQLTLLYRKFGYEA